MHQVRPFFHRVRELRTSGISRSFSSTRNLYKSPARVDGAPIDSPHEMPLSPRWLSDLKSRIKKIQDSSPEKMERASILSDDIEARWLELLAGPEGFPTSPEWRGLDGREIVWGEMVSGRNNFIQSQAANVTRLDVSNV